MSNAPDYSRRTVDDELDDLLGSLPALAIEGVKGVGKTATAQQRATTTLRLDDVGQRQLVAADPDRALAAPTPVLLDEWQHAPEVWDRVRRAVDDGAAPGSFLLTGSAAPVDLPIHSGAGRIVTLRMRPMSLTERGVCTPTISLGELLTGMRPAVAGESTLDLEVLANTY